MTVYTHQSHSDIIGTLMILAMFTAVATIVGLTVKPTPLVEGGDYGPADTDPNYQSALAKAKANGDSSPRLCSKCSLDPKKLYGYGFGIPVGIAVGLWLALILWRAKNPTIEAYYKLKAQAQGGKLEGADENALRSIQMQNMRPDNTDQIMAQQRMAMQRQVQNEANASNEAFLRQRQQQQPLGFTGGGWVRGRFPNYRS